MNLKTIILLSAKRTGSSAIFESFKKHPKVSCVLKESDIGMIELNFWNYANRAIKGNSSGLRIMLKRINYTRKIPKKISKKKIFKIWNQILKKNGGIIFDKSPGYLNNIENLKLINDFKINGNKVIIIGLIRDPKDSISSQHELWDKNLSKKQLKRKIKIRESKWIKQYKNLEEFQKILKFEIYRYEDLCWKKNFLKKFLINVHFLIIPT